MGFPWLFHYNRTAPKHGVGIKELSTFTTGNKYYYRRLRPYCLSLLPYQLEQVLVCKYLLLIAATIGHFQWSFEEIEADLVDWWLEKIIFH